MREFISVSILASIWLFQGIHGLVIFSLTIYRHVLNYFPFSIISLETKV